MALLLFCGGAVRAEEVKVNDIYAFEVVTIGGETNKLEQYKGKVLLIVNTASKCGFTGQYEGLQRLYAEFKEQGLVVLGFPSNDFMRQEPGSNAEIQSFCTLNYGVTFPMFAKIEVAGKNPHPLYTWLTSKATNPATAGKISWNFNKFLIARDGTVAGRFGSRTKPDDAELTQAVKAALAR